MFNEVSGSKLASKTILLLTNRDNPHATDASLKRQALKKSKDLQETGILLDILAVQDQAEFDMSKFYADMLPSTAFDGTDVTQKDNVFTANSRKFEDLLQIVRKKVHKKRSTGKFNFEIGNGINLAISSYNLVQKAYRPSKVLLARDTNEFIIRQRNFIHPRTGAPLLPSDVDMFQQYGDRKIRFTQDEVKAMMVMGMEPGLKLLGFRPLGLFKYHHFVKSCSFIYPDESIIKGMRHSIYRVFQRSLY